MRRVAITGIGIVSPVGIGRDAFWSSLIAGHSGHRSDFAVRRVRFSRANRRGGQGLRRRTGPRVLPCVASDQGSQGAAGACGGSSRRLAMLA